MLRYIILQGKITPTIETYDVENYCPGKPILPLGCYKYEEVSVTDRFHRFHAEPSMNVFCRGILCAFLNRDFIEILLSIDCQ